MPKFRTTKAAEAQYIRQLRRVAREVGGIVAKYLDGDRIVDPDGLAKLLELYGNALEPWASRVVTAMLRQVSGDNLRAWEGRSKEIGTRLRSTLADAKVGAVARQLHTDQVALIKSLPPDAGARAQELARKAQLAGIRANVTAEKIAEDLAGTADYVANRATLIARTETAKANASLTQARAEFAGVTHYIWRTAGDGDVRESHADLEGQVFRFDTPPDVEGEGAHHPGDFPNCRCYAEPVVPGTAEYDAAAADGTLDAAMAPWTPRKAGNRWARW